MKHCMQAAQVCLDDYLTASQAAQWFEVAPPTIRVWIHRRNIAAVTDPAGSIVRHPETGEKIYRLIDLARAEYATRQRARRA